MSFGNLLHVNLSTGRMEPFQADPAHVADFIGGSGLGARLLWDHLPADPAAPEAPLILLTGPLTGTGGGAVGRFTVCARSPRTGLWGESNCGGFWGPELRFAGYDGLLITGRANSPVYLWINDGRAELRDASRLWGRTDTQQAQAAIREEVGESRARVLTIGPAGEQRIPLANLITEGRHAAGRTGLGAVMGSKNLKAVAVRGNDRPTLVHPQRFAELRSRVNRELKEHIFSTALRMAGSSVGTELFAMLGSLTARYFTLGQFPDAERVSGSEMAETILTGISACHGCVIGCGRRVTISEGPYAGPETDGPEYETICGFGPQLMISDLAAITHLARLCDRYGLDTISTSGTIGLAFYLFDQGIIGTRETGGLELTWGDAAAAARLIEMLVHQEGLGELLAQGSLALARHFGVEELAVQINGLEVPYHDPRGFSSMALVLATSPRGACHNQGDYYMVELGQAGDALGIPLMDNRQEEGKSPYIARMQDWRSVCNSLVLCFFAAVPPDDVAALLNAATGREWDWEEMLRAGERIWNLKRLLNCRMGYTPAGERLPYLLRQPLAEGPAQGYVPDLERMRQEYYEVRGWDEDTGRPRPEKLEELGLGWARGFVGA